MVLVALAERRLTSQFLHRSGLIRVPATISLSHFIDGCFGKRGIAWIRVNKNMGSASRSQKSKAHVREQGGIFAHELYQLRMGRLEFFDGFL